MLHFIMWNNRETTVITYFIAINRHLFKMLSFLVWVFFFRLLEQNKTCHVTEILQLLSPKAFPRVENFDKTLTPKEKKKEVT